MEDSIGVKDSLTSDSSDKDMSTIVKLTKAHEQFEADV